MRVLIFKCVNGTAPFYLCDVLTPAASIHTRVNGGGNQAYSRLSTTHGHITDCKLDLVVYAGVCV